MGDGTEQVAFSSLLMHKLRRNIARLRNLYRITLYRYANCIVTHVLWSSASSSATFKPTNPRQDQLGSASLQGYSPFSANYQKFSFELATHTHTQAHAS